MECKVSVIIPTYNGEAYILRALRSIPNRSDVEIIIVIDGSTDGTLDELLTFRKYSDYEFVVINYSENKGPGYAINRGLDVAQGEYVVILSDDDYFLNFNELTDKLMWGMTYFNLQLDDGSLYEMSPETRDIHKGSTKFIKRSFLGDIRCDEVYWGQDINFHKRLIEKNPTELYTGIIGKHYTQRVGSLTYNKLKEQQ